GLILGAIYVLLALGLNVILGLIGVINFAHAAFYMLGAYLTLSFAPHIGFLPAVAAAAVVVGVLGMAMEVSVIRPLYRRIPEHALLLTFGLTLVAEQAVRWHWGDYAKNFDPPSFLSGGFSPAGWAASGVRSSAGCCSGSSGPCSSTGGARPPSWSRSSSWPGCCSCGPGASSASRGCSSEAAPLQASPGVLRHRPLRLPVSGGGPGQEHLQRQRVPRLGHLRHRPQPAVAPHRRRQLRARHVLRAGRLHRRPGVPPRRLRPLGPGGGGGGGHGRRLAAGQDHRAPGHRHLLRHDHAGSGGDVLLHRHP